MTRYFLAVDSRDHILTGVSAGFCAPGTGDESLFLEMTAGDWIACYSPRELHRLRTPCRRFTAIGRVAKGRVTSPGGSEGLAGAHRPCRYVRCFPVPAALLVRSLSFVRDKKKWEPSFRRGFFEVTYADFAVIAQAMLSRVDWERI